MKHIEKPNFQLNAKQIFELCAKGYSNQILLEKLLECADYVENDSSVFDDTFPVSLKELKKSQFSNGITNKQMVDLYTNKFAKKKAPGRKFYDKILTSAERKICPICGVRQIRNLDHYMPKSQFGTLVVTPNNLVPMCVDCNTEKGFYSFSEAEDAPLHPYFDDIDSDIWLKVNLVSYQSVKYYVDCPNYWDQDLMKRVNKHLKIYKLDLFYATIASQEIVDDIDNWYGLLCNAGESSLFAYLNSRKSSIEKNYLNSWKAALYRELASDFDTVLYWIKLYEATTTPRTVDSNSTFADV